MNFKDQNLKIVEFSSNSIKDIELLRNNDKKLRNEKEKTIISKEIQINRLKNEIKDLKNSSLKKFKEIGESQIKKKLGYKTKEELIIMLKKFNIDDNNIYELSKKEIIDSVYEEKLIVYETKRNNGKKKNVIPKFEKNELELLNKERYDVLKTKYGIKMDYMDTNFGGFNFTPLFEVYGIKNFQNLFYENLILWYSNNGWNQEKFGKIVIDSLNESELKNLKLYLPHQSLLFEQKFLESIKNKTIIPEEYLILEKWTRKGFCCNIGCQQSYSKCDFKIKYKVYFLKKYSSFKYELLVKGKHDNLLIGEAKGNALSISFKSE